MGLVWLVKVWLGNVLCVVVGEWEVGWCVCVGFWKELYCR